MRLWKPPHTGLSHETDVSFCLFCLMSWCLSWRSWCAAALNVFMAVNINKVAATYCMGCLTPLRSNRRWRHYSDPKHWLASGRLHTASIFSWALKVEAMCTSETFVIIYKTTKSYIPEYRSLVLISSFLHDHVKTQTVSHRLPTAAARLMWDL
jgi:hypothetical protein